MKSVILLILCLAAGACSTTTAAYKASFTLSVPEPIPDSALVRADIRADDLSAVLASAEGLVFVPPESCLSGAHCDALIESFEVAAAKLGAKVIPWREAAGQDAQTLTFLGAGLLVEIEELQVSESRFSEEGGLAVALSSVRKSRQVPRSRPTLSFRRDEAGRLVRMTPSELSRQVTEVTRVTDPRVIARINNTCVQYDVDIINDIVTSIGVQLRIKVRRVEDNEVIWIYDASCVGSTHNMEGELELTRHFEIETDNRGNIRGLLTTMGLIASVVGGVSMVANLDDEEGFEVSREVARTGVSTMAVALDGSDSIQPPICRDKNLDTFVHELFALTTPEETNKRLKGVLIDSFLSRLVHIQSLGDVPLSEVDDFGEGPPE